MVAAKPSAAAEAPSTTETTATTKHPGTSTEGEAGWETSAATEEIGKVWPRAYLIFACVVASPLHRIRQNGMSLDDEFELLLVPTLKCRTNQKVKSRWDRYVEYLVGMVLQALLSVSFLNLDFCAVSGNAYNKREG